jgi:hypothetical protein
LARYFVNNSLFILSRILFPGSFENLRLEQMHFFEVHLLQTHRPQPAELRSALRGRRRMRRSAAAMQQKNDEFFDQL